MKIGTQIVLVTALLSISAPARADVKLPAIFSDHMVLQRDMSDPIWGWADPGEEITVTIADQSHKTTADDKGKWTVRLTKLPAGGPLTLSIKGKNTLAIQDILVGEVWLGSGQSNMGFTVKTAKDAEAEMKAANYPKIRLFKESSSGSAAPEKIGSGKWIICSPDTVGVFSAALYFFGRELHRTLNVPVGLISSAVGGTPIEQWIDADAQHKTAELKPFFEGGGGKVDVEKAKAAYEKELAAWKEAAAKARAAKQPVPKKPVDPLAPLARKVGELFNGKINPLIPYAIRGAIWYQGEANTTPDKAPFYQYQLPLLVKDWRARWGQGDFPFAWVQLPNFDGPGREWPTVREAMRKALVLPNTGMAITIDIGEAKNIHPQNKQDVGRRLAAWALGTVYGQKVVPSGPLPTVSKALSGGIQVQFNYADGLCAKDGDPKGFEVAGQDGKWHPAKAAIDGSAVAVSSPNVPKPTAVRYAWANNPVCNLYNSSGLPMSPFALELKATKP